MGRRKNRADEFVSGEPAREIPQQDVIRTRPIRTTVDLMPAAHKDLKRWALGAALELDLTSVPLAGVLRALAAELTNADPETRLPGLEDRIKDRLRSAEH